MARHDQYQCFSYDNTKDGEVDGVGDGEVDGVGDGEVDGEVDGVGDGWWRQHECPVC